MSAVYDIFFWFFGTSAVLFALGVLLFHKLLHAAFSLMGSFLSVAGLIMMLGAPFVAISQVLIYIGGILILIVFGVFLTNKEQENTAQIDLGLFPLIRLLGTLGLFLGGYMVLVAQWTPVIDDPFIKNQVQSTSDLGFQLLTYAALPLQLIALLLLLVLIASTWFGSLYQKTEDGEL